MKITPRFFAFLPLAAGLLSPVHGNDERISVAGIRTFLEFVYDAVTDAAGVN